MNQSAGQALTALRKELGRERLQNGQLQNEVAREHSGKADMKAAIDAQQRRIWQMEVEKGRREGTMGSQAWTLRV
jgi:hypothetical protein